MTRALVLNASFEPLSVVSCRRALLLVLDTKAEVLHEGAEVFHSEFLAIPAPSVIRLMYYVKVPYQPTASLNRRAVFARDEHRCQYCGSAAENIDHVIPKSRGGTHTWENVVAACKSCNSRKEDRLLHETSLILRRSPSTPRHRAWVLAAMGRVEAAWEPYLHVASSMSA